VTSGGTGPLCSAAYVPTYGAQRTCSRDCGVILRRNRKLEQRKRRGQVA
jgi:predicted nucleic acid-binding Zn ribbon protein